MAEKKVHKQEKPNPKEPTPQKKKARDMRKSGLGLSAISERLNISRDQVQELCVGVILDPKDSASKIKIEAGKQYEKDQENKAKTKAANAEVREDNKKAETKKGK